MPDPRPIAFVSLAFISVAGLLAVAGCDPAARSVPPAAPRGAVASTPTGPRVVEAPLAPSGLDEATLDRAVDPCADFYQFACGGWLASATIPGDQPAYARGFSVIADRNEATLRAILEDAAVAKERDDVTAKLGTFYAACLDEPAIEAASTKPIEPLLAIVRQVRDAKTFATAVAELHKRQIWALFEVGAVQDFKDATKVIALVEQEGLGLPDRDDYIRDDDASKKLRKEYADHVARMLVLAGSSARAAKTQAADVMRIETGLAKGQKTQVERRDPVGLYNKVDREGLRRLAPKLAWDDYLTGIGLASAGDVNVTAPRYLETISALLATEKPGAWQSYLAWRVVEVTESLLGRRFADERFAFLSAVLGQKEQRARWKRCIAATDAALGDLLAQPFVKRSFSPESKEAVDTYVREVSAAFSRSLERLGWMDTATRARAEEKRAQLAYLVGYPARWKAYDFDVGRTSYAENMLAARAWAQGRKLRKVGKAVDREEWSITPQTVDAGYNALRNQMVFPAGILQPPFFSPTASIPVNLGSLGLVIGHELTHAFDDQGAQFDARGNLADWWTRDVGARFKAKTECVADQYGAYEALPGLKLDGHFTLGENIADGGGVKLAFAAYRAMRAGAREVVKAGGFTEDQQFFLGFGQAFCSKQTDELTRLEVRTDPHAPARFRVNGPLSNLPEFAEAFACPAGAPMRRANACVVW